MSIRLAFSLIAGAIVGSAPAIVRSADAAPPQDSAATPNQESADGFVDLFDGHSLRGWEQHGGEANYVAAEGVIKGTSVPNTSNSFLVTERDYGDFILEYETKVHPDLNSGVQIRSQVFEDAKQVPLGDGKTKTIPAGRVHGYQVELDANKPDRAWMAGVYDEARRGWLYPGVLGGDPQAFTEQGQRLYKPEQWNKIRVEAVGDSIKTYLNGELRSDFRDGLTPTGFIGLQVHGVGGNPQPLYAMWRNIRIKELNPQK